MVIWPNKLLCLSSSTVSTTGVKSCSVDLYQIRPVSQATKFAERSERVEYNKITWQFYKERCFWIGQTLFFNVQYIHDIIHNLYVETEGIPQHGWINLQGSSRAKMLGLHLTPDPPSVCTMCTLCWISTMLGA